jgi:plastocyanin
MRKVVLVAVFAAALAMGGGSALAKDVAVGINAAGFTPAAVTVQNGDRVVWTNNDKSSHQIVADDGSFRSPALAPGERWGHVFKNAGTFPYHDANQTTKRGTVVVTGGRGVSIDTNRRVLTFGGFVQLSGSVSSGKAGEQVVIRQKPQGSDIFLRVTTVSTTANGLWQARVQPRRNTQYQAVWKNVTSATEAIFVKPLLKLRRTAARRFALGIHAQAAFRSRYVVVQRWRARTHRWVALRTARVTIVRAAGTQSISTAVFRVRVRRGTPVRAWLPRSQAMPAYYGPAWTRSVRV